MRPQLLILRNNDARDYSAAEHLRFVVVDLDRAKEYPANFVCMLPIRLSFNDNKSTIFERTFGKNSLSLAKKLLADSLKSEADVDFKTEIERRLKLFDPQ